MRHLKLKADLKTGFKSTHLKSFNLKLCCDYRWVRKTLEYFMAEECNIKRFGIPNVSTCLVSTRYRRHGCLSCFRQIFQVFNQRYDKKKKNGKPSKQPCSYTRWPSTIKGNCQNIFTKQDSNTLLICWLQTTLRIDLLTPAQKLHLHRCKRSSRFKK